MKRSGEEAYQVWKRTGIIIWTILGCLILLFALAFVIKKIQPIFFLFMLTAVIVYAMEPLVRYFESQRTPRLVAVIFAYFLVIFFVILIFVYLAPIVVQQGREFTANLPGYVKRATELMEAYQKELVGVRVPRMAGELLEDALNSLKDATLRLLSRLPGITVNVLSGLFYLVLAPVLAFYILKDLKKIKLTVKHLIRGKHREEILTILRKINIILGGFLKGRLLLALCVGILAIIALMILGVDFAIVLGIIVGVLDVIPYFGPMVGGLLVVLVAFIKSPILALWVVVAMVIIQSIESMILSPTIMSQQVNLHPVTVVFALLVGGMLFGFMGLLLAIPLLAVGKALVYHFLDKVDY
jgi:predicted PurR-regulated permease PerM